MSGGQPIESCDPRWLITVGQYRATNENYGSPTVSRNTLCHTDPDSGDQICAKTDYLKQVYEVTCVSTNNSKTTSQCMAKDKP